MGIVHQLGGAVDPHGNRVRAGKAPMALPDKTLKHAAARNAPAGRGRRDAVTEDQHMDDERPARDISPEKSDAGLDPVAVAKALLEGTIGARLEAIERAQEALRILCENIRHAVTQNVTQTVTEMGAGDVTRPETVTRKKPAGAKVAPKAKGKSPAQRQKDYRKRKAVKGV